jgi:hypothetical protein
MELLPWMVQAEQMDAQKGLVVVAPRCIGKTTYALWRLIERIRASRGGSCALYLAPNTGMVRSAAGIARAIAEGCADIQPRSCERHIHFVSGAIIHLIADGQTMPRDVVDPVEAAIDEPEYCSSDVVAKAHKAKLIFAVGTRTAVERERRPDLFERLWLRAFPGPFFQDGWRSMATGPSPLIAGLTEDLRRNFRRDLGHRLFHLQHSGEGFEPLGT